MTQRNELETVAEAIEAIRETDSETATGNDDVELSGLVGELVLAYLERVKVRRPDRLPDPSVAESAASGFLAVTKRQRRDYNPPCTCDLYADLPNHRHNDMGCSAENERNRFCLCMHRA